MLPSAIAFLHEGFGFFEGFPGVDEYFKVAGSPVAYPADVAGEARLKGVVVGVEFEVEGDFFCGEDDTGKVFDLFEGEVLFSFLFIDVISQAAEVVGDCVIEFPEVRVEQGFAFGEGFVFGMGGCFVQFFLVCG